MESGINGEWTNGRSVGAGIIIEDGIICDEITGKLKDV